MRRVAYILILFIILAAGKKKKHKRKKVKIEYEYLPEDYKDPKTVICTKPNAPSKGRPESNYCIKKEFLFQEVAGPQSGDI